jgi:phosphatidylglycerol:prolipoprotein diacylglycerol transferase
LDLRYLNPYAFHLGPIGVHWYGIFMVLSMALGAWYLYRRGTAAGIEGDFLVNAATWAVVGGVVGARLVFVLANDPQWIWQDPAQILRVWQGGLAWDGGLLGGVLTGWWYLARHGHRASRFLDWAVPGLALGYILVRVGNIFNHEVLGRHALMFHLERWPAQPIGSTIGLILLLRYFYLERRQLPIGYQFWSFSFYYQLGRGLVEETVRNNPLYLIHYVNPTWGIGFTTMEQLFTVPILVVSWLGMRRMKQLASGRPSG